MKIKIKTKIHAHKNITSSNADKLGDSAVANTWPACALLNSSGYNRSCEAKPRKCLTRVIF